MIKAEFLRQGDLYTGFRVSGHAGFADKGYDIVCAGVSSAVQMAANGITDVWDVPAKVVCEDDLIGLTLPDGGTDIGCQLLIQSLYLQLSLLCEGYEGTIEILNTEV